MLQSKLLSTFSCKEICNRQKKCVPCRKIQVSIVGAANAVGSNLAILAKQNQKIYKLQLYDKDAKVKALAMELNTIPGGPKVSSWTGDGRLHLAIQDSHLILMVFRVPRKPGDTREQMIAVNAPTVEKLCRAVVDYNPHALVAIATNPINSMVPFASALMYKYNGYNPFKVFGVTHIDTERIRSLAAEMLQINPFEVSVPVIGGHSENTIVPLFSNMVPISHLDPQDATTLTQILRKAGTEVVFRKSGQDSATLAMAVAVNEFLNLIVDAIAGKEVTVNAFTANNNFGTRFFSGPTTVGPYGITKFCEGFQLNDYETFLLNSSIPIINRDVGLGENYVQFIDTIKSK